MARAVSRYLQMKALRDMSKHCGQAGAMSMWELVHARMGGTWWRVVCQRWLDAAMGKMTKRLVRLARIEGMSPVETLGSIPSFLTTRIY